VIRKEVLENGLTVLTEQIQGIRSVSLGIWLKKGSRDESSEEAGIYHFIEHMLFKGTRRRDAYQIARTIDAIGGYTDAFTSKENTCFYAKVLDEHLPVILELFSDILVSPRFDSEDIERERKVIHEEISMVEDTPSDLVHELFVENFWGDHPLGRPILGTVRTVDSMNQKTLRARFTASYIPSNMVFAVAGNLTHEEIIAAIQRYFLLVDGAREPDQPFAGTPPEPRPLLMVHPKKELEQSHICMGTTAYSVLDEKKYPASVMNVILGGSMSSRLFQKIREELGLCYTVFSSLNFYEDCGYLDVYAATSSENVKNTIELMMQECDDIARQPVSREDLEHAKSHLKGSLILSLESSSTKMFNLAKNDMYYGRQIDTQEILDKISGVTIDDVQAVAQEIFLHPGYGIVVVGDLEEVDINLDREEIRH